MCDTSGWSYDAKLAVAKRPELELFLEQVLPIAEERHVVLSYIASLLSGHRRAKKFLIFTDRSDGNNGKSKLADLVKKFYGRMADDNGKKFVCRPVTEHGDRNSQDAGKQFMKNKRVVVAEELKQHMLLDESLLKELVSPDPMVSGRGFHEAKSFQFAWTAGFILIMNAGCMPKVDPADNAFWSRVIVVPFRSKFLPEAAIKPSEATEVEEDKNEPSFVFPMDQGVGAKFVGWLSAFADVLCEHYDASNKVFDELPASMGRWKDGVKAVNNPVAEWLETTALEFTNNTTDLSHRVIFDDQFVRVMYDRFVQDKNSSTIRIDGFRVMASAFLKDRCRECHIGDGKPARVRLPCGGSKNSKNVMIGLRIKAHDDSADVADMMDV